MSGPYDIVAMGAGHNGLVAAAYLAKAGKKVLVLERKAWPGGGVATRQLTVPGYWHDEHSSVHIMIQGNPMLTQDELGLLSKFGLKYIYSDIPYASIYEDQTSIVSYKDLDKTCQSIAKVSAKDAETYHKFALRSSQMLPLIVAGLYSPPVPMGPFMAMLDSSDEGRELFDAMQRSCLDIANLLYENDKVKIHLLKLVSENLQMPDELGTGMGMFLMPGIIHTYGVSQPVGGSGKLTEALVKCIEHWGGEIRCNAEVRKVLTSAGRATGVETVDGAQFMAKDGVIGAIHPKKLKQFIDGVPAPVLARADRVTLGTFTLFVSHYALKSRATFHAGEEVGRAVMCEYLLDKQAQGDASGLRRAAARAGSEAAADRRGRYQHQRSEPRATRCWPVPRHMLRALRTCRWRPVPLGRDQRGQGRRAPRILPSILQQPHRRQYRRAHDLFAA